MESEIPTPKYGSKEAVELGIQPPKSDAAETAMNRENRLGDSTSAELPNEAESLETRQTRLDDMANRLGGTMLSGEVEDPRK